MGVYLRIWKKRKEHATFEIWAGRQEWLRAGLMVKDEANLFDALKEGYYGKF